MGVLVKRFKKNLWSLWVGTPLSQQYIRSVAYCGTSTPCPSGVAFLSLARRHAYRPGGSAGSFMYCSLWWRAVSLQTLLSCISSLRHMANTWHACGRHMPDTWHAHGRHMAKSARHMPDTWQARGKTCQAHAQHMACTWQAHGKTCQAHARHMAGTWQNLPGTCLTHGMHMAGTWQNLAGTWQAHSITSRQCYTPATCCIHRSAHAHQQTEKCAVTGNKTASMQDAYAKLRAALTDVEAWSKRAQHGRVLLHDLLISQHAAADVYGKLRYGSLNIWQSVMHETSGHVLTFLLTKYCPGPLHSINKYWIGSKTGKVIHSTYEVWMPH